MLLTISANELIKAYEVYQYIEKSGYKIHNTLTKDERKLILNAITTNSIIEFNVTEHVTERLVGFILDEQSELNKAIVTLLNACGLDFDNFYNTESTSLRILAYEVINKQLYFVFTDFDKLQFQNVNTSTTLSGLIEESDNKDVKLLRSKYLKDISFEELEKYVNLCVVSINKMLQQYIITKQLHEVENI